MTISAPSDASLAASPHPPSVLAPDSWRWRRTALPAIAAHLISELGPGGRGSSAQVAAFAATGHRARAARCGGCTRRANDRAGSCNRGISGAGRQDCRSADHVGELLAGLLDLEEWRFEFGSPRSNPPRLEADARLAAGDRAWDVEEACLPAELELSVFGHGQYHGRFLLKPGAGWRPPVRARLGAVALAGQMGRAYSAGQPAGSAR
jgi:hypothetical protein